VDTVDTEKKWLTEADRKAIGELSQQTIDDRRMTFYVGHKGGKPVGYMVMDHVVGKSLPISFMVVLNTDGTARDVEIMVYREPQGWEIRYESFLKQFLGRNSSFDPREINSITGATLSVRSITRGVAKILAAYKTLYLDKRD
jgi:Na+-translocating ferredoxin:NAD+ oxidoreductase RnfG subunit